MLFSVVAAFFTFESSSFAATVGQQLTAPEAGWTRYDDSNPAFNYDSSFTTDGVSSSNYKATDHITYTTNGAVTFKFIGTKLRIIAAKGPNRTSQVNITIDGNLQSYSQNAATGVYQILVCEKLNLPNQIHTVEIKGLGLTSALGMDLDAIDIDSNGYLINQSINPPSLNATAGDSRIDLNWSTETDATQYNVKRSTTPGGPYETIATVETTTYSDKSVMNGTTYYYVVTATNASGESAPSNEASATPNVTGRAILTITMTNGIEKEYDLSMDEVNAFISWYEAKDSGPGSAIYTFNKYWNKGPFKARTEYVIFDKILTFDVDEYNPIQ